MFKLFINGVQIGNYRSFKDTLKSIHDYTQTYGFTEKRLDPDTVKWDGKSCHISTVDRYL